MKQSQIREKAINGLKAGDTFSVSRKITKQDVLQFGEISRDHNPVHYNEQFAKIKKFDRCISHGLLVASLVTEIGGQLGWLASMMSFEFKKPVYFGETLKCVLTIIEIDERARATAEALITNEENTLILKAKLSGIVPEREEREVMKTMSNPETTSG